MKDVPSVLLHELYDIPHRTLSFITLPDLLSSPDLRAKNFLSESLYVVLFLCYWFYEMGVRGSNMVLLLSLSLDK